MSRILFISPHPDDETLGCGGTILKHREKEDSIFWLIMTAISSEIGYDTQQARARDNQIKAVANAYGFEKVFLLNMPTTKLDTVPRAEMVESVSRVIDEIKPVDVYLPHRNDIHSDHKVTFDVAISATKTFRSPSIKRVFMYEVISETEFSPPIENNAFLPNSFSDITNQIDRKVEIMNIYKGEMGTHPFPRSAENIKALATFRGATAGVRYAEAFMILKEVW